MVVEQPVGDGKSPEGLLDGVRLEVEPASATHFGGEDRRKKDYDHRPASTDWTGGSWRASSVQLPASSAEAKTEPL